MQLEQFFRQRGLRLTRHRRIILEVLETAQDHPCARELHDRITRDHPVSLTALYRVLNSLTAVGLVTRHELGDGKARYKRAGTDLRHHLVDVTTGRIVEVDHMELTRLLEAAARALGYRLVNYRLRLFGSRPIAPSGSKS